MSKIADPIREYASAVRACHLTDIHGKKREYVDATTKDLLVIADAIDADYKERITSCRRSVRRDFARYIRSVIADYEKGVSRRNRNHAHCVETIDEDGIVGHARCSVCQQAISSYDSFCRHCGAKLTGTDYRHEGE